FGLIPDAPPSRVIAMLLAPPRIPPRRLEMSVLQWTDPYVGPGRRHRQRLDPGELRGIPDHLALGIPKNEPAGDCPARDTGLPVIDVPQPCGLGRIHVLGCRDRDIRLRGPAVHHGSWQS